MGDRLGREWRLGDAASQTLGCCASWHADILAGPLAEPLTPEGMGLASGGIGTVDVACNDQQSGGTVGGWNPKAGQEWAGRARRLHGFVSVPIGSPHHPEHTSIRVARQPVARSFAPVQKTVDGAVLRSGPGASVGHGRGHTRNRPMTTGVPPNPVSSPENRWSWPWTRQPSRSLFLEVSTYPCTL